MINGLLQTINRADSPNVQLIAFDSNISTAFTNQGLGGSLLYDVQFANVDYAGVSRRLSTTLRSPPRLQQPRSH